MAEYSCFDLGVSVFRQANACRNVLKSLFDVVVIVVGFLVQGLLFHDGSSDVIVSNPVHMARLVNALVNAGCETDEKSCRVQSIGPGVRVWPEMAVRQQMESAFQGEDLDWKKVKT